MLIKVMSVNVMQLVYFLQCLNSTHLRNYNDSSKETQSKFIKLKDKSMHLIKQIVKSLNLNSCNPGN